MQNRILICLALVVSLSSCTIGGDKKADYLEGQKIYEKNCTTCHARNDKTSFRPSLIEMSKIDSLLFIEKWRRIIKDKNHKFLDDSLTQSQIKDLCYFICNYKTIVE